MSAGKSPDLRSVEEGGGKREKKPVPFCVKATCLLLIYGWFGLLGLFATFGLWIPPFKSTAATNGTAVVDETLTSTFLVSVPVSFCFLSCCCCCLCCMCPVKGERDGDVDDEPIDLDGVPAPLAWAVEVSQRVSRALPSDTLAGRYSRRASKRLSVRASRASARLSSRVSSSRWASSARIGPSKGSRGGRQRMAPSAGGSEVSGVDSARDSAVSGVPPQPLTVRTTKASFAPTLTDANHWGKQAYAGGISPARDIASR